VSDKIIHKVYISQDKVGPALAGFGADIKTAGTYQKASRKLSQPLVPERINWC
jgi:hypothetical protein